MGNSGFLSNWICQKVSKYIRTLYPTRKIVEFEALNSSADYHLEYSRAVYSRLRMNISASNGAVLKVVGLKLAKRGSVKVWGILVKNSPFCLKMSASGNSNS